MLKQPAIVNYFFSDAYTDLAATIKDTFSKLGEQIRDNADNIADDWDNLKDHLSDLLDEFWQIFPAIGWTFLLGFHLGQIILSSIITSILCALFSLFHVIIVGIIMAFVYLGFITALGLDKLYCLFRGIGTTCPAPGCQTHIGLPVYICRCGAKHTQLLPSRYGILNRTCKCGRKLPTTFFSGRDNLVKKVGGTWVCPECGYDFGGRSTQTIDITIPVAGGPSSGKTCFLTQAIREIESQAPKYGLEFEYIENPALGDDYKHNKGLFEHGQLPNKTNDYNLRYYQFYLSPKGAKVKNIVSICDVAGEAFDASDDAIGHQMGLKNAKAFLITLDPLSVSGFRDELKDKGFNYSRYMASEKFSLDDVLLTLIRNLENLHAISASKKVAADVVVTFTKCDIPALEGVFGANALANYQAKHNINSAYEATNRMCEEFLKKYGENNFLNSLKSKFRSVQFFTSSALGHVENGTKFKPAGVEEPLLWLIDKESGSINLKEVWGKKI